MKTSALLGRVIFSLIFLSSGLDKLYNSDLKTGGPIMDYMAPKMDNFVQKLEQYAGTKLPITKDKYPYILAAATALELTGSLFFIFDSAMGAKTLLLFLVPVSFIMHNFWDVPAKNSELRMQETIHFSKNLALCGALLFYLGMKRR